MAGRITAIVTLALSSVCCATALAQPGYMPPGSMAVPPGPGYQMPPGPAAQMPPGYGLQTVPANYLPPGYPAPQYHPAMGAPEYAGGGPACPPGMDCPPMAGGVDCYPPMGANIINERLPEDRGWTYGESPADRLLKATLRNTWVRFSYMLWNVGGPGDAMLGAPLNGVLDPAEPFPVTLLGLPATAQVPSLGTVSLQDLNGLEAVVGVPLSFGTIEGSIFKLERNSDEIRFPGLPSSDVVGERFFYVTSTLTNGEVGDNIFAYDSSFTATFTTDWWGTDLNLVLNPHDPGTGLDFQPIFGFKYLNHWERLRQVGVFDGFGQLDPLTSEINSKTRNHVYAPQLGLRTEVDSKWVTLGVEPKIAFGVNNYETNLVVERLRAPGDPRVETVDDGVAFSPIFDLDVYGRLHVNENFSLYVSYNLMLVTKFARPHSSIRYDDFGVGAAEAGLSTDPGFDNITLHGMTVGGEFRFR